LKNHATATLKTAAFHALKTFFSAFNKYLSSNLNIPDETLVSIGLPSREHHAHLPIPVPVEAPVLSVVTGQHHDITVYVSNAAARTSDSISQRREILRLSAEIQN
jgi:hypothetical protein